MKTVTLKAWAVWDKNNQKIENNEWWEDKESACEMKQYFKKQFPLYRFKVIPITITYQIPTGKKGE